MVFFTAVFGYLFAAFVALPILGILMSIKVIRIRKKSRKLTHSKLTKQNNKTSGLDIKLLISQICVSNFAIIFNIPCAFVFLIFPCN